MYIYLYAEMEFVQEQPERHSLDGANASLVSKISIVLQWVTL